MKQYDAFGLKAKLPLVGSGGLPDERLLAAMGASSVGITTSTFYVTTFDTPANREFVEILPFEVQRGDGRDLRFRLCRSHGHRCGHRGGEREGR